jgi:hypothetical protein
MRVPSYLFAFSSMTFSRKLRLTMERTLNPEPDTDDLVKMIESLESQLVALYEEKRNLHLAIGVSDDKSIIRMVKSLEDQVNLHYRSLDETVHND